MEAFNKSSYFSSEIDNVIFEGLYPCITQLMVTPAAFASTFSYFYNFGHRQIRKKDIGKEGLIGKCRMNFFGDTERW